MVNMKINKMPSKELLEEYLEGGHGNNPVTVYFNILKGEFERSDESKYYHSIKERGVPIKNG